MDEQINELVSQIEALLAKGEDMTPEDEQLVEELKAQVEELKAKQTAEYSRQKNAEWLKGFKSEQATFSKKPAPRKTDAPSPAPAIHTKKHEYSVSRAINLFLSDKKIDGLEGDIDTRLRENYHKEVKGFMMPRHLRNRKYATWNTTTGGSNGLTDPQRAAEYLDVLRAYNPLEKMGVTFREGMKESTKFINFTKDPGLYFPPEGSDGTDDIPTQLSYTHTPHTGIVRVPMTRNFAYTNEIAGEFIEDKLAVGIGVGVARIAFAGDGVNEPTGVFVKSGLPSVSLSTLSRANLIKMEQAVDVANGIEGEVGYVGSPYARTALRSATSVANFPDWLLKDDNTINGYPYFNTMCIPNIGSPVKGALAFANWKYLEVSFFGDGIDILPDPFSLSKSGTVVINGYVTMDVQIAKTDAFAVSKDITITV